VAVFLVSLRIASRRLYFGALCCAALRIFSSFYIFCYLFFASFRPCLHIGAQRVCSSSWLCALKTIHKEVRRRPGDITPKQARTINPN
jgi:hypothetical protein